MTELVPAGEMDREKIELVKRTIAKGASDDELALFIAQVNRTKLDPFSRQIYCIGRYDSRARREVFQTQVSIDGARLVAQRTGEYAGQTPTLWTADGKVWVDVWLEKDPPAAAKVGVYRQGFVEPMWAVATWVQYVQQYKKENQWFPTPMWQKMGPLMLGKCAEMLALRKAFPMELSGLYAPEEMAQAEPVAAPEQQAEHAPQRARLRPAPTPAKKETVTSDGEIVDGEVVPAISPEEARRLGQLLSSVPSLTDAESRRAYISDFIGHEHSNPKDLTRDEYDAVVKELEAITEAGEADSPAYSHQGAADDEGRPFE